MGKNTQKGKLAREFSAGGVVFKEKDNTWLLIQPFGTDRWQLPKGLIDKKESSKETAVREVEEEGGVVAEIVGKAGDISYIYFWEGKRISKRVSFFLMKYLRDASVGHDKEVEEATFFPFKQALEKLSFKSEREILEKAKEILL